MRPQRGCRQGLHRGVCLVVCSDPGHETQLHGGIADFWYLEDGDILCDPRLVVPLLARFDAANLLAGAGRNCQKTEVIYFAQDWQVDEVRRQAEVRTAEQGGLTLGVATGPLEVVKAQMEQKIDVVRAMQSKVKLCRDAGTEYVLNRQSLGVGRVNHILRVHREDLLREGGASRRDGSF